MRRVFSKFFLKHDQNNAFHGVERKKERDQSGYISKNAHQLCSGHDPPKFISSVDARFIAQAERPWWRTRDVDHEKSNTVEEHIFISEPVYSVLLVIYGNLMTLSVASWNEIIFLY